MNETDGVGATWRTREERLADAERSYVDVMTTRGPDTSFAYYDAGVVGFVFGEMWPRPGLSRKDRRWVTLACVASAAVVTPVQTHVYAALKSGDCTLEEMDECGLHLAIQLGWPKGQIFNRHLIEAINQIATERGLEPKRPTVLPWAGPAPIDERLARGQAVYEEVMMAPAPAASTTFRRVGYFAYFYGEIWPRGGLTRRERRILSICSAAIVGADLELKAHVSAALRSRDLSYDELQEIVLHYAVYQGWLAGAELDQTIAVVHAGLNATPQ